MSGLIIRSYEISLISFNSLISNVTCVKVLMETFFVWFKDCVFFKYQIQLFKQFFGFFNNLRGIRKSGRNNL